MIHSRIRRVALALALSLSLVVPGAALAATETLTVTSAQTFEGVPASIDYGSVVQAQFATAPTFVITAGNVNGGYVVSATFTNLTGTPSGSLPAAQRAVKLSTASAVTKLPNSTANHWAGGTLAHAIHGWTGNTTKTPIYSTSSGSPTSSTVTVALGVQTLAGTTPASYTGTATFTYEPG